MDFVRSVLASHLPAYGVEVHPILLGKKLKHDIADAPGGVLKYAPVYRHIQSTLRSYSAESSRVTTMFDLYAFPRDFPDYEKHASIKDPFERVTALESAIRHQVNNPRFIPNIQLHEFETLVLSKPDEVLEEFAENAPTDGLAALVSDLGTRKPEEVNQTKEGAPSKRLERFLPGYRKRRMGPSITRRIGFGHLRETCPHFGAWLSTLESLGDIG